jgi:Lrp/AsnC family transcriptional regulator, leucine-responsive regulatory protein
MSSESSLDSFDLGILRMLAEDGRATQADLGDRVNLSGPAAGRRQRLLEERGYISGYHAKLGLPTIGFGVTVIVLVQLERQNGGMIAAFEAAVKTSPSVISCHLLSGGEDYFLILLARSLDDFERIHREELTLLPNVARMQSLFSLREVVGNQVPSAAFAFS